MTAQQTPTRQGEADAPEWLPTNTLDRQIARARDEMGESEWRRLNAEWLSDYRSIR